MDSVFKNIIKKKEETAKKELVAEPTAPQTLPVSSYRRLIAPPKEDGKVYIEDNRDVVGVSGQPMKLGNIQTGNYNQELVTNIAKAAKVAGVDPYTALAIAMQESKIGKEHENVGQIDYGQWADDKKMKDFISKNKGIDEDALMLAYVLKNKVDSAKRKGYIDAMQIQGYNGYGKLGKNNDIGATKMYGVDLSKNTINMAKTPLYGKAVIDLRDNILKKNKSITDLVDSIQSK